jgi:putative oxidoreductase
MNSITTWIRSASGEVTRALAAVVPSLTRLCLGFVFVQSGWGKLHDLSRVVATFGSLGIPAPQLQAPFVATVELVGGSLLLLGLLTRPAALPLAATMVVALATAKADDLRGLGDLFSTVEFLYLLALGQLAAFGPGPASIDHLLSGRVKPSAPTGI